MPARSSGNLLLNSANRSPFPPQSRTTFMTRLSAISATNLRFKVPGHTFSLALCALRISRFWDAERFHKKPTSRLDSPKPCVSQLAANEDSSSTFYFTYELLESNSLNHAANVMEHTVKVTRCVTPNVNNLITV